ncbi:acyl carrier protein [Microvirga sp. M2]|uniref:acyl carrier protein n=1 Tax=Microvirga sp. M2 TaxID=3073270 RepID=UPI0039C0FFFE
MTDLDIRTIIHHELRRIAPDIDVAAIHLDGDLREECDIDSMDFLNLIAALHQRLGVDVPERDYRKLITLNGAVDYLQQKLAEA